MNKNNGKSKQPCADEDFDSQSDLLSAEEYEKSMITTIVEFSDFVMGITTDLEEQEKLDIETAISNGEKPPKVIWKDSTFKIKFTKGLLLTIFKPERLIKYYNIFVLPMKPWLEKRDSKFFLENDHIYPGAPKDDIQFFKDLWQIEGTMTQDEQNTIWEFFDTLIEIAEDWKEVTGWVPAEHENLIIPDIDYGKVAKSKNGKSNSNTKSTSNKKTNHKKY